MENIKRSFFHQGREASNSERASKSERRGDHLRETPIQQDNGLLPTTIQQASDRFHAVLEPISRSSHTSHQKVASTRRRFVVEHR
jgi:hypothetical protein